MEESTYQQHRREMMGTLCRRQTNGEVSDDEVVETRQKPSISVLFFCFWFFFFLSFMWVVRWSA
jgi:hypothetical protein